MARIKINPLCNVCTKEHSKAYIPRVGDPDPEITIPVHRLRLHVTEARAMRDYLTEAIEYVEKLLDPESTNHQLPGGRV